MEVWKDVVGFEEYFKVSSFGRLFSKRTGKVLKQFLNKSGYVTVATRIGGRSGKSYCFKLHRVVAEAFIDNLEFKPEVNHIDGDKTNNCVENLELVTPKENIAHAFSAGLMRPKPSTRVLKPEDVDLIFSLYRSGKHTHRSLSNMFGVSHVAIGKVLRKEHYVL